MKTKSLHDAFSPIASLVAEFLLVVIDSSPKSNFKASTLQVVSCCKQLSRVAHELELNDVYRSKMEGYCAELEKSTLLLDAGSDAFIKNPLDNDGMTQGIQLLVKSVKSILDTFDDYEIFKIKTIGAHCMDCIRDQNRLLMKPYVTNYYELVHYRLSDVLFNEIALADQLSNVKLNIQLLEENVNLDLCVFTDVIRAIDHLIDMEGDVEKKKVDLNQVHSSIDQFSMQDPNSLLQKVIQRNEDPQNLVNEAEKLSLYNNNVKNAAQTLATSDDRHAAGKVVEDQIKGLEERLLKDVELKKHLAYAGDLIKNGEEEKADAYIKKLLDMNIDSLDESELKSKLIEYKQNYPKGAARALKEFKRILKLEHQEDVKQATFIKQEPSPTATVIPSATQNAVDDLKSLVSLYDPTSNPLIKTTITVANHLNALQSLEISSNQSKKELIELSKQVTISVNEIVKHAQVILDNCYDSRLKMNLANTLVKVPTLATQLRIVTSVKASNPTYSDSDKLLFTAITNLLGLLKETIELSESASIRSVISSQEKTKTLEFKKAIPIVKL